MLDDDAYAWFTEHGGLTRANGQRLREDLCLEAAEAIEARLGLPTPIDPA